MKRVSSRALVGILFCATLSLAASLRAQIHPARVDALTVKTAPYNSTGLVFTEVNGFAYRGSAVVARDPRLIYTCAHVLFDEGVWATDIQFARAWHSSVAPSSSQMVLVRGYRYYTTYSGGDSAADFADDFAIGYRNASTVFGPALGYYTNAGPDLRNDSVRKMILGYPARIDYDLTRGFYYQHQTGPFSLALRQSVDSYHVRSGVSTGPGNSGGPVLAFTNGEYRLAAILVSGSRTSLGVHGLDAASTTMGTNILAELGDAPVVVPGTTATAKNTAALALPDAASTYSERKLVLANLPPSTTAVKFSLLIDTTFRGDLDVYVRSPAGRVRWVNQHGLDQASTSLVVGNANYTSAFSGANPNGTWKLFMRDYYRSDRAYYRNASLTVTSR